MKYLVVFLTTLAFYTCQNLEASALIAKVPDNKPVSSADSTVDRNGNPLVFEDSSLITGHPTIPKTPVTRKQIDCAIVANQVEYEKNNESSNPAPEPTQCRVQTNQRPDGVTIRYLTPDRVGYCDKLMLALSMQTNGEEYFISTISVFEQNAMKLKGALTLKFENNKSSTFLHYRSEITTYNGYPATISIFQVAKGDFDNIQSSNVKYVMLQLETDIYQNVSVKMNADILKKHFNCLK